MKTLWSLALASGALSLSAQGYAANAAPACNTFASGYTEDADRYFHLNSGTGLGDQPVERVADLARLLDGEWRGHSSGLNCVGHYTRSQSQATRFEVRAEITRKFNGAIKLEAEQSDARRVKLTRLYLAPELARSNAPMWQNYTIEFLSPTRVKFDHKYRTRDGDQSDRFFDEVADFPERAACVAELHPETGPQVCGSDINSSRLIHEIKEIHLDDDQLTVDHSLFMNGLFVSHERWLLERS